MHALDWVSLSKMLETLEDCYFAKDVAPGSVLLNHCGCAQAPPVQPHDDPADLPVLPEPALSGRKFNPRVSRSSLPLTSRNSKEWLPLLESTPQEPASYAALSPEETDRFSSPGHASPADVGQCQDQRGASALPGHIGACSSLIRDLVHAPAGARLLADPCEDPFVLVLALQLVHRNLDLACTGFFQCCLS